MGERASVRSFLLQLMNSGISSTAKEKLVTASRSAGLSHAGEIIVLTVPWRHRCWHKHRKTEAQTIDVLLFELFCSVLLILWSF